MNWIVNNWQLILTVIGVLISVLNALTKAKPQKLKWLKHVVAWLSFLKSADAPGTLKVPLTKEKQ